ncbi:hypothetical protein ACWKSP_41060 [Micromonosporaceae bacterium Da 78-11]
MPGKAAKHRMYDTAAFKAANTIWVCERLVAPALTHSRCRSVTDR